MRTAAYSITAVSVVNRPEKASQNRTIVKIGIELQSVDSPTWEDFAIMAMVERGMGVGILPDMILRRIPYRLEIRPLKEPYYRSIGLAMKHAAHLTPPPANSSTICHSVKLIVHNARSKNEPAPENLSGAGYCRF